MSAVLYYVHDPMCSWCWGHRPVWDAVKAQLPPSIQVEYVLGGLAPDCDTPMPEPLRQTIQGHWQRIHTMLGTPFNFDFWTQNIPRRSTYMACRAVLAAGQQGLDLAMINAIQQAYYLRALNPSDTAILKQLAVELQQKGQAMDTTTFAAQLQSSAIEQQLQQQIALARDLTAEGFPSMVLQYKPEGVMQERRVLVPLDYRDPQTTLKYIQETLHGKG